MHQTSKAETQSKPNKIFKQKQQKKKKPSLVYAVTDLMSALLDM